MLKSSTISAKDSVSSIAIGGFDGLHLAHQALLARLGDNGALLIIERGCKEALTPGEERCRYTPYPCFFLDFQAVRGISAEAFGRFLREAFPSLEKIVVGYDFRFGKDRRGTPGTLRVYAGVEVEVVEEQRAGDLPIHSNTIREILRKGDVAAAANLLGRPYRIRGSVIRGQGLGKTTFFPTLNIETDNFLLPGEGVYVTQTGIDGTFYPSVTFIGKRQTTDNLFSVETHLLDYVTDADPDEVEILFLEYLRGNRKFDYFEDLKMQIAEDIEEAKRYHRQTV